MLSELAQHVVEPDVCVLVVGEVEHADFYREITRGLGSLPPNISASRSSCATRCYGILAHSGKAAHWPRRRCCYRAIAVTGVRGGVGATTIAVNLAWHFGVGMRRHTVLLDPDTHLGSTAFLLNIQPGPGLAHGAGIAGPYRQPAGRTRGDPYSTGCTFWPRKKKIASQASHAAGAGAALLTALRNRYNFIIVDVPFAPVPLFRDLLDLVDQRILGDGPIAGGEIRDTVRLLGLPKGPAQDQREPSWCSIGPALRQD